MYLFSRKNIGLPHVFLAVCLGSVSIARAQVVAEVDFNSGFLNFGKGESLDISRFGRGNAIEPGIYAYDVWVNDAWVGREDLRIIAGKNGTGNEICFSGKQVQAWGLNFSALANADELEKKIHEDGCIDILGLIPDTKVDLSVSELLVRVSIPQAYIQRNVRGYVAPEKWDNGIVAGFVNYGLNAYNMDYRDGGTYTSVFGLLNLGLNVGAWRLRNNSSYEYQSGSSTKYRSINAYAQRDIVPLYSTLTVGQHYTSGRVFQSFPYTGFQVSSSEAMLPDSQSGFAPVIRGIADTNAKVGVYQEGNLVYETTVTPGAFVIDDLSNTGVSGNLEVVVTESSGQIKRFTVPYASVVQLLRPGASRYSLAVGRYRDKGLEDVPNFLEATYQRGLSNFVSAYGGALVAQDYYSGLFGMAFNTQLGALAADVTHSSAKNLTRSWLHDGEKSDGQSYSLSYSKLVTETNTNLTLAAYRFSSKGYLNFDDYARARSASKPNGSSWRDDGYFYASIFPQRNRFQVSVNQELGRYGSIYMSGSTQSYWNSMLSRNTTYMLGYSRSFNWGQMTLNVSRFNNKGFSSSTQTSISLNIPLGDVGSGTMLSTSASHSTDGNNQVNSTVTGRLPSDNLDNSIYYSVFGSRNNGSGGNSSTVGGGSLQYDGRYAQLSGNASVSSNGVKQLGMNMSGAVVVHSRDISLTRNQGDSFAIVHVPGAEGANVNGMGQINSKGYGVASNLYPYRENSVSINPDGSSLDVEIVGTSKSVAPTAGAIVYLEYETREGKAVLLDILLSGKNRPPLGASVLNENNQFVTQVGQMGRAFIRGVEAPAKLLVSWGDDDKSKCMIEFDYLGDGVDAGSSTFEQRQVNCQSLG